MHTYLPGFRIITDSYSIIIPAKAVRVKKGEWLVKLFVYRVWAKNMLRVHLSVCFCFYSFNRYICTCVKLPFQTLQLLNKPCLVYIFHLPLYFFGWTGMMWMRLFTASLEEIYSHSHNPNCYTPHPSGKTDSHIAGCRITLSQQDRNERRQWQNICDNAAYLRLASSKLGSRSLYWPSFTPLRGFHLFKLQISCHSPALLLGWDFRGVGELICDVQQ